MIHHENSIHRILRIERLNTVSMHTDFKWNNLSFKFCFHLPWPVAKCQVILHLIVPSCWSKLIRMATTGRKEERKLKLLKSIPYSTLQGSSITYPYQRRIWTDYLPMYLLKTDTEITIVLDHMNDIIKDHVQLSNGLHFRILWISS